MRCLICNGKTHLLKDPQLPFTYHVCENCFFIFKDPSHRISKELEHAEYKRHNNTMESTGYVNMFNDLIETYIKPLHIGGKVLEYGSGPGPVLYQLLQIEGYDVTQYDPFYHPDTSYQAKQYALITSTEVVEHFFDPMKEFKHLSGLLEKDGYLLIMTHIRNENEDRFLKWWYRRDITHVSFYHLDTLQFIANACGLALIKHNDKNIILFQKK